MAAEMAKCEWHNIKSTVVELVSWLRRTDSMYSGKPLPHSWWFQTGCFLFIYFIFLKFICWCLVILPFDRKLQQKLLSGRWVFLMTCFHKMHGRYFLSQLYAIHSFSLLIIQTQTTHKDIMFVNISISCFAIQFSYNILSINEDLWNKLDTEHLEIDNKWLLRPSSLHLFPGQLSNHCAV